MADESTQKTEVSFTVHSKPVAKARARASGGRFYTPLKTSDYEKLVKSYAVFAMREKKIIDSQCALRIVFFMPIPKSVSLKSREKMLSGDIRPDKKPDFDNLTKAVMDAMNGIVYKDDAQIVEATISKWYSDEPRAVVWVGRK